MKTMDLKYNLVLASKSPRRRNLLEQTGLNFRVLVRDTEETFEEGMEIGDIAMHIAKGKAAAVLPEIDENELIIAADTIVCKNGKVYGKPESKRHAVEILRQLSGRTHEVVTGVCLQTQGERRFFFEVTKVFFGELGDQAINYYVDTCKPFDKAGSYAIQEWIGIVGIYRLEGCYYNVMGLPVNRLLRELAKFPA